MQKIPGRGEENPGQLQASRKNIETETSFSAFRTPRIPSPSSNTYIQRLFISFQSKESFKYWIFILGGEFAVNNGEN